MSRTIRRVPMDWQHPKYEAASNCNLQAVGRYIPKFDKDIDTANAEWLSACIAWSKGEHEEQDQAHKYYWQYAGGPPDQSKYRDRVWTPEEAVGYQIYEDVSEGTPVSPIFEGIEQLINWLVTVHGNTVQVATGFAERGWALNCRGFTICPIERL